MQRVRKRRHRRADVLGRDRGQRIDAHHPQQDHAHLLQRLQEDAPEPEPVPDQIVYPANGEKNRDDAENRLVVQSFVPRFASCWVLFYIAECRAATFSRLFPGARRFFLTNAAFPAML